MRPKARTYFFGEKRVTSMSSTIAFGHRLVSVRTTCLNGRGLTFFASLHRERKQLAPVSGQKFNIPCSAGIGKCERLVQPTNRYLPLLLPGPCFKSTPLVV